MIGVAIIADNGAAMRRLSEILSELPDVHIVRHCSGGAPVAATVAATAPDVVLLDELRWPGMTVQRIAEIRAMSDAPVIVCAARLDAGWLADALRAGASALVPRAADATTLRTVIGEVVLADAFQPPHDRVQAA
jgi:DNA-binding NarL/FixJ family response regulator